jgi:hypothetical protein
LDEAQQNLLGLPSLSCSSYFESLRAPMRPTLRASVCGGIRLHRTGPGCTRIHRFQAAAVFYPILYPTRQDSGVEELSLLVTVTSWSGRSEFVTSFPSWACGFDSRHSLHKVPVH